jgi:hypothetical protein
MQDSKLIEILKTFSKNEWKQFEKFIASPFFNNGRNYIPLYKQLQRYHPKFDNPKLTYEYLYQRIYPGRKFNKQVMWNMASELEKLSREFILQLGFRENKVERFNVMFNEFFNRKLDRHVLKEIENLEEFLNTEKAGQLYFDKKRVLEEAKIEYWNSIKGRQDKALEGIIKVAGYFFLYFFSEFSIQVWDLNIMKKMYNPGESTTSALELFKMTDLEKTVLYAEEKKYEYAPMLRFYYNKIMCALDEENEHYFFDMKNFFESNSGLFSTGEQKNIIITLANYCANKMRLGSEYYIRELFEINKIRLKKEFPGNSRINKALFHQVLKNALSLKEIKWAEDFITDYTPRLNAEYREPMKSLALGYLSFAKGDYRKTLHYINETEFIDIRDKLHIRILSAKSYYELKEMELLMHYIDSSRHFISSSESLEDETRDAYLKFFRYLEKLVLYIEGSDSLTPGSLRESIENDKALRSRHGEWFNEKLTELENKRSAINK